ncbi:MAG: ROK family protein [Mailhella sp.]|nr:ROK family protein [Mailhella sp.]
MMTLDLGGTNSVFGIVGRTGTIQAKASLKTNDHEDAEDFVRSSAALLRQMADSIGCRQAAKALGIGAPDANHSRGTMEMAHNVKWGHDRIIPLAAMFEEALHIPAVLINDADAAALGEMRCGAARGMKDFILLTLGTGVGSGIVIDGKLVHGSDGFAGELGHVVMRREHGRPCACGRKGCLEAYCSAAGVVRTAREMLAESKRPSLLRESGTRRITPEDVAFAAQKGDELAQDVYRHTGQILGEACAEFAAFCSPEAFIFFGGLTGAWDLLLPAMRESYEKNVFHLYRGKARFLLSELRGGEAALLGAAAQAWEIAGA